MNDKFKNYKHQGVVYSLKKKSDNLLILKSSILKSKFYLKRSFDDGLDGNSPLQIISAYRKSDGKHVYTTDSSLDFNLPDDLNVNELDFLHCNIVTHGKY